MSTQIDPQALAVELAKAHGELFKREEESRGIRDAAGGLVYKALQAYQAMQAENADLRQQLVELAHAKAQGVVVPQNWTPDEGPFWRIR